MKAIVSLLLLLPYVVYGAQLGCVQCPKEDGLYSHPGKHDSFVKCVQGVASFHDCPEGLIFLKNEKSCGFQKTKDILKPSRFSGIKLTACPKKSGTDPYLSSSTSTSGACGSGCSAYSGFTTSPDIHSVCRVEGGETCANPILTRGLSADYEAAIVDAHNVKRNELAGGGSTSSSVGALPSASNMVELIYNGELAKVAQAWTDLCVQGHDCYDCRKISSDPSATIGQNGYFLFNLDTAEPDPTNVVTAWWDEINDLTSLSVIDGYNGEAGHFTQVAWAETSQVGCGWTVEAPASSGDFNMHFFFCNYNSAGNYANNPVYVPGAPATLCPFLKKDELQKKGLTETLEDKEQKAYEYLCGPSSVPDPCAE